MLYLIWTILNFGLFLLFIIICFQATKLVREKLGLVTSIVFAFGLLSFVNSSSSGNNQVRKWNFTTEDEIMSNTTNYSNITIDKTLISTIALGVLYGKEKTSNKNVGIEANSSLFGFLGGHNWKPQFISVEATPAEGKLKYYVTGLLEWKSLGTTIYSQSKIYSGIINAN